MSLITVFLTIYNILYTIYEIEIAALAFGKLAMKKMGWMNPTPTPLKFETFYFVLRGAYEGV